MGDFEKEHRDAGFERRVERLALGELSGEERGLLERQAAARGEDLGRRVESLRASNDEILSQYPAEMMAARIEARLDGRREFRQRRASASPAVRWFAGLGALGAAGAAVLLFVNSGAPTPPRHGAPRIMGESVVSGESVRIKGAESKLVVWRKSSKKAERLEDGDSARAGDLLQLEYNAAGAPYGVIVSLDGRGAVTLHHPLRPDGDARLEKGVTALDFAYQLDDAPAFERFFFVTSQKPLKIKEIIHSIEELSAEANARKGTPAIPPHARITSFIVEKK
jgi:hypothetical protein